MFWVLGLVCVRTGSGHWEVQGSYVLVRFRVYEFGEPYETEHGKLTGNWGCLERFGSYVPAMAESHLL